MIRQYSIILISAIILLTSANCKKNQEKSVDISSIETKLWLHSYEEDSAGITTYRPEDFNLPPSRGRKGFKIMRDSTFIFYAIAPTDGWNKHPGKWSLKDEKTLSINFGNKSVPPKTWEIILLSKDKIQIKDLSKN